MQDTLPLPINTTSVETSTSELPAIVRSPQSIICLVAPPSGAIRYSLSGKRQKRLNINLSGSNSICRVKVTPKMIEFIRTSLISFLHIVITPNMFAGIHHYDKVDGDGVIIALLYYISSQRFTKFLSIFEKTEINLLIKNIGCGHCRRVLLYK